MKRATLSIKQMQKLLETQHNRTMTDRWRTLHQQMVNGQWNPDVAPIILFDDGTLADGQHRIRAAVEMNEPFVCWVVTIPHSDITKVDAGRSRSTRDHCRMLGLPIHALHCAAARSILWLRDNEWAKSKVYPHADIIEAAQTYLVSDRPRPARELSGGSQFLAAWCFIRWHCAAEFDRTWDVDEFFTSVNTGESLEAGSPALALRKRLLQHARVSGSDVQASFLWLNVRAWNLHVTGEPVVRLQLPEKINPIRPILQRSN